MKKKMKFYEQPTVKVVRFMVEQGFAGSDPGATGEGSGNNPDNPGGDFVIGRRGLGSISSRRDETPEMGGGKF